MLVCAALFDAAAGLFTAVPETGAFDISSGSGVANGDMHTDYFQFTGRQVCAIKFYDDVSYNSIGSIAVAVVTTTGCQ
jgi:hypothetical protein